MNKSTEYKGRITMYEREYTTYIKNITTYMQIYFVSYSLGL